MKSHEFLINKNINLYQLQKSRFLFGNIFVLYSSDKFFWASSFTMKKKLLACDCRQECVKGSCLCIHIRTKSTKSCKIDSSGNMQNNDMNQMQ